MKDTAAQFWEKKSNIGYRKKSCIQARQYGRTAEQCWIQKIVDAETKCWTQKHNVGHRRKKFDTEGQC